MGVHNGETVFHAHSELPTGFPQVVTSVKNSNCPIRTDNGSGYISQEFRLVLKENGLGHDRIKPHCPEENGVIERAYRTLREELEGESLVS